MATIHLSLQGKGGVGKSFLALMLAMYYQDNDLKLDIYDTDPINATLFGFKSLNAKKFEIMKKDNIDKRSFDNLFTNVIGSTNDVLIDIGSNGFITLCSYILSNQLLEMLHNAGHQVIIHTSIVGGQNLIHTVNGFDALIKQFTDTAKFVIWLNPYWGEVIYQNMHFEELKVYKTHKNRISAIINIPEFDSDLHGQDLAAMLEAGLTFSDVRKMQKIKESENKQMPTFDIFSQHRLNLVSETIYNLIKQSTIIKA